MINIKTFPMSPSFSNFFWAYYIILSSFVLTAKLWHMHGSGHVAAVSLFDGSAIDSNEIVRFVLSSQWHGVVAMVFSFVFAKSLKCCDLVEWNCKITKCHLNNNVASSFIFLFILSLYESNHKMKEAVF